ncbi:hypothetical protein [Actinoplanes solisilvae]|uniref:hypothetical protein n=1 Tax=Actinoplanes solisilvae TaxID=2486853 RepID=UPI000FDAFA6D|nr:hypothetical protein [Actinoplanes solisilvae]
MDVFSRTFLPAAAEGGVAIPTVSRHLPVVRRCVEPDETTVLVGRCLRPEAPMAGEFMLVLTQRRLVVTQETKVFHRLRLHLNANLRHLSNVSWSPSASRTALDIAATAVDGVRERFRMRLNDSDTVWHMDALLRQVFHAKSAQALAA